MSFDPYLEESIRSFLPATPPIESTQKTEKPKRPPNAYNLFFMENQATLKSENILLSGNQVSQELGKRWKEMNEEQRRPYIERAAAIREKFKQENPDYHYEKKADKKKLKRPRNLERNTIMNENTDSHFTFDVLSFVMSSMISQSVFQNKALINSINSSVTPDLLPILLQNFFESK
ncbi:HMG box family protein [Tritrichomonas foetus]|uniref:HMG box family protein n=1 Tax=Tritrichomonas foetus TaxID=1144522 RepID=A0A1J4KAQ9_9EUKA|nr:HMG box family protein [Tritrichomonas foetus]|eukprot:OHT08323.1 HMG box family protein [Tritrichomonas foetus]